MNSCLTERKEGCTNGNWHSIRSSAIVFLLAVCIQTPMEARSIALDMDGDGDLNHVAARHTPGLDYWPEQAARPPQLMVPTVAGEVQRRHAGICADERYRTVEYDLAGRRLTNGGIKEPNKV